jgi:hypothetical protein
LRTEEKKREALRLKDLKNTPPDTPATPVTPIDALSVPTLSHESAPSATLDLKDGAPQAASEELPMSVDQDGQVSSAETGAAAGLTEAQRDIPQPSIEVRTLMHHSLSLMLTMFRKLHLAKNQQKIAPQLPKKPAMIM